MSSLYFKDVHKNEAVSIIDTASFLKLFHSWNYFKFAIVQYLCPCLSCCWCFLLFFAFQLSRPVTLSQVTVFWRSAYSDIVFTNHEKDPGLFYLLMGLDANATYFIKVHLLSKEASISISDEMSVTTNAKRTYFRIALNSSPVDELGNWCH